MDRRYNLRNDSSLKIKTQKLSFFKKSYCVGYSVGGAIGPPLTLRGDPCLGELFFKILYYRTESCDPWVG